MFFKKNSLVFLTEQLLKGAFQIVVITFSFTWQASFFARQFTSHLIVVSSLSATHL
jgi:hypothetical protein